MFGLARSPDPPRGPCGIRRLGYPPYPGSGPLRPPPEDTPETRLPRTPPRVPPGTPRQPTPKAPPKAPPRTPPPRPRPPPTRLPTPPTLAPGFRKVPRIDPSPRLARNESKLNKTYYYQYDQKYNNQDQQVNEESVALRTRRSIS